jgi:hypothetical protein
LIFSCILQFNYNRLHSLETIGIYDVNTPKSCMDPSKLLKTVHLALL